MAAHVEAVDYKFHSQRDRDGVVAELRLTRAGKNAVKGKRKWCIVQNIDLELQYTPLGGRTQRESWSYSELFLRKSSRSKLKDYFTVSKDHREGTAGFLHVQATAWVVPRRPLGYKVSRAGQKPWGSLPGSADQPRPPPHALKRECRIEWGHGTDLTVDYY